MDTTIILPAGGKLHASRSHLCLAFEKTRFSLSGKTFCFRKTVSLIRKPT